MDFNMSGGGSGRGHGRGYGRSYGYGGYGPYGYGGYPGYGGGWGGGVILVMVAVIRVAMAVAMPRMAMLRLSQLHRLHRLHQASKSCPGSSSLCSIRRPSGRRSSFRERQLLADSRLTGNMPMLDSVKGKRQLRTSIQKFATRRIREAQRTASVAAIAVNRLHSISPAARTGHRSAPRPRTAAPPAGSPY